MLINGLVVFQVLILQIGAWGQAVFATDDNEAKSVAVEQWHEDAGSGVRFPVPFKIGRQKTTQQAQNLILSEVGVKIPVNAKVTTALYSERDLPFILVWKIEAKLAATLGDLAAMAAQVGELHGLSNWQFNQNRLRGTATVTFPSSSLGASLLVQLVDDGAVVLGYYYRDLTDAAQFASVAEGFTLTTAKVLRPKPRTLGLLFKDTDIYIILAIAGAFTMAALWFLGRRDRLP